MITAVLMINLLSTWYMVGAIWVVQIVHYALFDRVGADQFPRYERDHARIITPVVGIPMLCEMGTSVWLIIHSPAGISRTWFLLGGLLVVGLWISTAMLQVPCHNALAKEFDQRAYKKLVRTNWIRTVGWSARGILMAFLVWKCLSDSASVA